MHWQPFMGSVVLAVKNIATKLIFRPLLKFFVYVLTHPITITLRLFQLLVLFILISILSTFFVLSYASTDYVPAQPVSTGVYYSIPVSPRTLVVSSTAAGACSEIGGNWARTDWGNGNYSDYFCRTSGGNFNYLNGPYTCPTTDAPPICDLSYKCPPDDHIEYTVGPIDLAGVKVCYRRTCLSNNNWFDSSMELGTGSACSFGCQYTVTASYQSSTGNNAFIAKGSGDTCSCSGGATRCWQTRTPNTEGDNDDTGTCYAWDMGEVKGVDCGKNGQMEVDLGPINDSLVKQGKSITDLQTNDKLQNEYIVKNTNDIAGLRVDVDALKAQGCSVSQTANGVTITCNGQSVSALNGKDGVDGKDGVSGARGADGAPGEKGEKGDKGDTGATGATGEKGEKGDKGDKGDQGEDGQDGEAGQMGQKGETGAQGIAGVAGAAGRDGVDGKDGEKGEDGESLSAVQDGDDVGIISASTGARLATLKGIDRDGIVSELQKSNTKLTDIDDKLEDLTKTDVTTEVDADYSEKLKPNDWESRNFGTVLQEHITQMKQTELFQRVGAYFQINLSGGACTPIQFDMTVMGYTITTSADPFCTFQYWPLIQSVVMAVAGFFAFRVAIDN